MMSSFVCVSVLESKQATTFTMYVSPTFCGGAAGMVRGGDFEGDGLRQAGGRARVDGELEHCRYE
jgi:hypothetical protein